MSLEDDIKRQRDKAQRMTRLLDNEDFQELILEDFIKGGILDQSINQSLDSTYTIDELKARQILHKYIFNVIIVNE